MPHAAARRRLIRRLIDESTVSNQSELVQLLHDAGHDVTQATVSRDLVAVGAVKVSSDGTAYYQLGTRDVVASQLGQVVASFVEVIQPSGQLVVLRTPPGAAHIVAAALDGEPPSGVIGTVAGDDTVLVVTDAARGGESVAAFLEEKGAGA